MAAPAVARFEVTGNDGRAQQRFYGMGPAQDGGPGQVTFYVVGLSKGADQ